MIVFPPAPRIPRQAIASALAAGYGIRASSLTRPAGERDQTLLVASRGKRFILRITNAGDHPEAVPLETALVLAAAKCPSFDLPSVVPTRDGAF